MRNSKTQSTMGWTTRAVGILALVAGIGASACSDSSDEISVPDSATTGFDVTKDGFSFENYGGTSSFSSFGGAELIRLFGQEAVCVGGKLPCNVKPGALAWAKSVNESMGAGRCEGFAVLSELFRSGALRPSDFGADTAFGLDVNSNEKLGNEIAYWFGTQMAGSVLAGKTQKFEAKDVMPFLASILKPDASEAYRLGIVNKRGKEVFGGHALTPISYEKVGDGKYDLKVYDNNVPGEPRTLQIDVNANTWKYQGSLSPSDASGEFFGDSVNVNPMYFAPVKARVGTFACKFCDKGGTGQIVARSSGNLSVSDASGNGISMVDGQMTAQGGASVETAVGFSIPSSPLLIAELPSADANLSVTSTGSTSRVSVSGGVRSVSLQVDPPSNGEIPLPDRAEDGSLNPGAPRVEMTVGDSGIQTKGDPNAQSAITLSRALINPDGTQKTIELGVKVPAGSSITANVDDQGNLNAEVTGGSGDVVVQVTQTNGDQTSTSTFSTQVSADTGGSTKVQGAVPADPSAPITGTTTDGNGKTVELVDLCTNGVKDATEVDTDCGGTCGTCALGKTCATGVDCASGICNTTTKACVATTCDDGVKGNGEADVDCGSVCAVKCSDGGSCGVDADCLGGTCANATKTCQSFSCTDGIKNGDEGDVDCGGSCTSKCAVGQACLAPTDCAAGAICSLTGCIAAPTGGTITVAGGFRIHTFLASGSFQATGAIPVEYLIVAGGGGGGSGDGAGGGAGGVLTGFGQAPLGTSAVVIGAGGAGAGVGEIGSPSENGSDSSFIGLTAVGGGRGGQEDNLFGSGPLNDGGNGGSGGGFGGANAMVPGLFGQNTPGQGNVGGSRFFDPFAGIAFGMGGGGGAGAAGGMGGAANEGGDGGQGMQSQISGTLTFYGGGGGGSGRAITGGLGGQGGGGNGGLNADGQDGTPNTGGGGGGGGDQAKKGGAGGSGIVIIRYPFTP